MPLDTYLLLKVHVKQSEAVTVVINSIFVCSIHFSLKMYLIHSNVPVITTVQQ